ncbi:MAG TPA: amidohydrolase family protein [Burkholderiales bacterium]|jgi:aminocarboxymuconate-semialdehyde decarboxylase|nr:amidohydrolase family protein [Burkholderiales bacterium]
MPDGARAIDVHTHIMPPDWEDFAARFGIAGWPWVQKHSACSAAIMLGDREFRRVTDQCFAPVRRIADMDQDRIARQLLSPIPVLFCYWGSAEATAAFAQRQNDFIAETVSAHPHRFIAAGTVAMQSPRLAIRELERMSGMGFKAVEIGTNVAGRYPDDPGVVEVLQAASDLGIAVLIHPWDAIAEDQHRDYYLPHMVLLPAETALAIARLIFGGVLERLPHLRIAFAHGGGNFIPLLRRIDHGFRVRREARAVIDRPPSAYLRRLYFDSITHDTELLELLCKRVGSDRVMLGSDYPFDMGVQDPVGVLGETTLSEADRQNILHRTAEEFLGLEPAR